MAGSYHALGLAVEIDSSGGGAARVTRVVIDGQSALMRQ